MTLSKQIQKLVKGSSVIKTPRHALEVMFEEVFNTLPKQGLFLKAFPSGYLRCNPEFASRATYSHTDLENIKECVDTYLRMIVAAKPFEDVLGEEYDQYLGFDLGQFFTPSDVASLIGEINATTVKMKGKIAKNTPFSLHDLCCGGGALAMGVLKTLHQEHGKQAIALVDINAVDIDPNMCRLTTLQIVLSSMLHQVPFSSLRVDCGNPLISNEKLFAYVIPNVRSYLANHDMNELDRYEYDRQLRMQLKAA